MPKALWYSIFSRFYIIMNHGQLKMTQDYLECMNKKWIERLYPITVYIYWGYYWNVVIQLNPCEMGILQQKYIFHRLRKLYHISHGNWVWIIILKLFPASCSKNNWMTVLVMYRIVDNCLTYQIMRYTLIIFKLLYRVL